MLQARNLRRGRGNSSPLPFALLMVAVALIVLLPGAGLAQLPAFPGAEGEGMYTTGGRGGDVYHVTHLNNFGSGSLREAVTTGSVPRTVVFDVSGKIVLGSTLRITRSNITIAGQTAPEMGICLVNYGLRIDSGNVIVRHIRVRPGDAMKGPKPGFYGDAFEIKASGIMVDHCSASWAVDEDLSCAGASFSNVTVQYCTISEGLDQTGLYHDNWDDNYLPGGSGHHSMGSLIKPVNNTNGIATYHHNLWSQNGNRNPAVGTYANTNTLKADIRNNVMYNNRNNGYSSGESLRVDMNYVGNYIIAGNATSSSWWWRAFNAEAANNMYIYEANNKVDGDRDTVRDGTDTGWSMFSGTYTKLASPVSMKPVTTHTADEAYNLVINTAGAFYWNRDSTDARLIKNILTMKGTIINSQTEANDPNADPNGYPVIPYQTRATGWDTDNDGMPNFWESWYGSNASLYDPNGDRDGDGYLDLEEYLVWIYDPNSIHRPGDATCDNAVAFSDLSVLASNWLQTGKTWQDGDFNNNGTVDFTDLSTLSSNWGWSGAPPAPSPAPVPEPVSLSLLLAGGAFCAVTRRCRRTLR